MSLIRKGILGTLYSVMETAILDNRLLYRRWSMLHIRRERDKYYKKGLSFEGSRHYVGITICNASCLRNKYFRYTLNINWSSWSVELVKVRAPKNPHPVLDI